MPKAKIIDEPEKEKTTFFHENLTIRECFINLLSVDGLKAKNIDVEGTINSKQTGDMKKSITYLKGQVTQLKKDKNADTINEIIVALEKHGIIKRNEIPQLGNE